MNVYRVQRTDSLHYDQFDAFVCVAESEADALRMMPEHDCDAGPRERTSSQFDDHEWAWPADATLVATLIATNAEGPARVVLSSFNAG